MKGLLFPAKEHGLFPESNGMVLSMGVANMGFSGYGEEKKLEGSYLPQVGKQTRRSL